MTDAISTSLSGLRAQEARVNVSANNIANFLSTQQQVNGKTIDKPYEAKQAVDISQSPSGVKTVVQNLDPATVTAFFPASAGAGEDGLAELPNVDFGQDFVDQILAKNAYTAGAAVIRADNENQDELLKATKRD